MKVITNRIEQIYSASGKAVIWLNRNLGTREPDAPALAAAHRTLFNRWLRLWIAAVAIAAVAFGYLVYYTQKAVDQSLAASVPVPSLTDLHADWRWTTLASFALAAALIGLSWWAIRMRIRYGLRGVFIWVPVLIALACTAFRPIARLAVERRLTALFTQGLKLFDENTWDDCHTYYSRLYYIFPATLISDNCLGRMAGAHYHQGNYSQAIRDYAELLRLFPNTEIERSVRRSIEWTMTRLGAEETPETCASIYDKYRLFELGFPAFGFYLPNPMRAEAARPDLFGSMALGETAVNLRAFLDIYPRDAWAARAAYFLGDREVMQGYPDSAYHVAYGIVEGWHLQNQQRYTEAAALYEAFIKLHPRSPEAEATRVLLARCYLSATELEEALQKLLQQDTRNVPASLYYLYLERFAFLGDLGRARKLFADVHSALPGQLAADMALLLRERLVLEQSGLPGEETELLKFAHRARLLTRSPATDNSYSSAGEFIEENFDYGDELADFVNSRLRQSEYDVLFRHYIDRNYVRTGRIWPDSGPQSYTELLQVYVNRRLEEQQASLPVARFGALLHDLDTRFKDASLLDPTVKRFCAQLLETDAVLDLPTLRNVRQIARGENQHYFEALALRALRHVPADAAGVRRGIAIAEIGETAELHAALAELVEKHLTASTEFAAIETLVGVVRKSSRRTALISAVGPTIVQAYARLTPEPTARVSQSMLEFGLLSLRNRKTYHVSRAAFADYIRLWPENALTSNASMWLAWLDCFEAYEAASEAAQFRSAYERAREHYRRVSRTTEQLRIKFMALESERAIGRKLHLLETGAREPREMAIPEEIVLWGEPRERLSGTEWVIYGEEGRPARRIEFRGTRVRFPTTGDFVDAEYHLAIDERGHFNVLASSPSREGLLLTTMSITNAEIEVRFMQIDARGRSSSTFMRGILRTGSVARPALPRHPHPSG